MFLLFCIVIGLWLLYMGLKFYNRMDWDEPADYSPDLKGMHKREAELMHIQDVLEDAYHQGKLTKNVIEEFARFSEAEIKALKAVETTWKNRRKGGEPPHEPL